MIGPIEEVVQSLERGGVRYLIVGGVAVVLHGHLRTTADLDLWIELEDENLRGAVRCLHALGFRPRAPVSIDDLASAERRREWVEQKGLVVFSLWHPDHPLEIDVFVREPFDFSEADSRASDVTLEATKARVIGLADLIAMKEKVGRPEDREDVAALRSLGDAPTDEDTA
jgi:predicted nucleotidyltransferase